MIPLISESYLYEWSAPHGKAEHVSHDVVDDDHHDGNDEPDEPLEHVLDDQVALSHHAEKGYVGPGKKRELEIGWEFIKEMFTLDLNLSQIVLLHQGEHKPDKAEDVEGKRYQSMVSHQEGEEVYLMEFCFSC